VKGINLNLNNLPYYIENFANFLRLNENSETLKKIKQMLCSFQSHGLNVEGKEKIFDLMYYQ
jgi:hypothetical protein